MNQTNLNPAPVVSMRIKNTEISWLSEAGKNAQDKNKKLKKSLKKKKEND
ncbi:hypothetical protein NJT12_09660 [Flavobacterium sp. AC]|jgi:hypothetical protein|uniref:Uncharacterized protein n=1 Tax=Flavobacterium azizsancarii TaxID=2961580 RepID=A0ABT4WBC8_9FLAO|nr:hypothetical protein [Flavobacterium azizsancarii]MDA6069884.1 hypothetical protein [Flavobacterium azizsancarii]